MVGVDMKITLPTHYPTYINLMLASRKAIQEQQKHYWLEKNNSNSNIFNNRRQKTIALEASILASFHTIFTSFQQNCTQSSAITYF